MKKFFSLALAALAVSAAISVSPAEARQGCGVGFHRGPHGYCRVNHAHRPIGIYHHGRGYWDGHRYWAHRYWHHGGWRYR